MSKGKTAAKPAQTQIPATATASSKEKGMDPTLASLFASSSGPVSVPVRRPGPVTTTKVSREDDIDQSSEDLGNESEATYTSDEASSEDITEESAPRPKKRRKLSEEDDIETSYLNRLAREEQREATQRLKEKPKDVKVLDQEDLDGAETASSASNDLDDLSDLEADEAIPQHESLSKSTTDYDKTRRTVFLGNVSSEAIKSSASRKMLETHLKSVLDADANEKVESIRFRSTAFDVSAGPKKAAFAKKELMDETTKSTNAYVVLNTEAAAKKIAKKLNGTIILDRHLHTDWLAHPTVIDHKRCVFVGNLNFVNVESNTDTGENGEKQNRRPRAREPADAEEGLWRAFSKCGTVESVRVIRDKATRVGKGFAYVQFIDEVGAEKALALDGKKFPPMLPRLLRVSRAKRVMKKDLKRKREENDVPGRRGGSGMRRRENAPGPNRKKMAGVVFEGYRATADKPMKFRTKGAKKNKGGAVPATRSSKRGAAFKAGGGKKKRDAK